MMIFWGMGDDEWKVAQRVTGDYGNKQVHVYTDKRKDDFDCAIWWEKASRLITRSWSGNQISTTRGSGSSIECRPVAACRSHQNLFFRRRVGVGEEVFLSSVLQGMSRLKNNRAGARRWRGGRKSTISALKGRYGNFVPRTMILFKLTKVRKHPQLRFKHGLTNMLFAYSSPTHMRRFYSV